MAVQFVQGDSLSAFASLPRTIFASLARSHEHERVENVTGYFPQAELDGEINDRFLLNKHFFMYELKLHKINNNIFRLEE